LPRGMLRQLKKRAYQKDTVEAIEKHVRKMVKRWEEKVDEWVIVSKEGRNEEFDELQEEEDEEMDLVNVEKCERKEMLLRIVREEYGRGGHDLTIIVVVDAGLRLLLHAICGYYGLVSSSRDDMETGERQTYIRRGKGRSGTAGLQRLFAEEMFG